MAASDLPRNSDGRMGRLMSSRRFRFAAAFRAATAFACDSLQGCPLIGSTWAEPLPAATKHHSERGSEGGEVPSVDQSPGSHKETVSFHRGERVAKRNATWPFHCWASSLAASVTMNPYSSGLISLSSLTSSKSACLGRDFSLATTSQISRTRGCCSALLLRDQSAA